MKTFLAAFAAVVLGGLLLLAVAVTWQTAVVQRQFDAMCEQAITDRNFRLVVQCRDAYQRLVDEKRGRR